MVLSRRREEESGGERRRREREIMPSLMATSLRWRTHSARTNVFNPMEFDECGCPGFLPCKDGMGTGSAHWALGGTVEDWNQLPDRMPAVPRWLEGSVHWMESHLTAYSPSQENISPGTKQ